MNATATSIFTALDQAAPGARRILFITGARGTLAALPLDHRSIVIDPARWQHVAADLRAAAHRHARATYGPRRSWPSHIIVSRPTTPTADTWRGEWLGHDGTPGQQLTLAGLPEDVDQGALFA